MRPWHGIDRSEGANGNAAQQAINVRFYTEGELWRRNSIVRQLSPTTAFSLRSVVCFMPAGGKPSIVQADSNGTVSVRNAP